MAAAHPRAAYGTTIGLFLVALTTLMLELALIRVFDVIWYSNMAYMIVSLAMCCFAFAGVYAALRPLRDASRAPFYTGTLAVLFGLFSLAILPALNAIPVDFDLIYAQPRLGIPVALLAYLVLAIPFFLSGLIITTVFSVYPRDIQRLYLWDLAGAGIGCVVLLPLLPQIGAGGLLFAACAFGIWASAAFAGKRTWTVAALVVGTAVIAVPFLRVDGYFDFKELVSKRSLREFRAQGRIERTHWDPISKIEVVNFGRTRTIAYDGGSQTSDIFPFDGDFARLRASIPHDAGTHFPGGRSVLVSHFLKQDGGQRVLVIGSAGGQEVKAALMYGAGQVDAIELVEAVVRLGKEQYAAFNGGIYNHPRVDYRVGEGRSFLRASPHRYDIIQMFSNHTSSSIAAGTGAMATTYLQTVEAYVEYFSRLTPDGILHINHHVYPRMIATAARAWHRMGRTDFRRHVIVLETRAKVQDNLPTLLISMRPWTEAAVARAREFVGERAHIVEDPTRPQAGFLSDDFYTGELPAAVDADVPYRVGPTTDNRPYFNFLRKSLDRLEEDAARYVNHSTAALLNSQVRRGFLPTDIAHLVVTGVAALVFAGLFMLVPLLFSRTGRSRWPGKTPTLVYFSCLGLGFILFELVFIQLFMKLIGYPLYTYSTVVFTLLLAAGCGSYASGALGINPRRRWLWPFAGILATGLAFLALHDPVFNAFLTAPTWLRILVSMGLIFPTGFFLGMPLPLGVLALSEREHGAIPWAWGLNGLFTVVGGLLSVGLSLYFGFLETLVVALVVYALAAMVFVRIRAACLAPSA